MPKVHRGAVVAEIFEQTLEAEGGWKAGKTRGIYIKDDDRIIRKELPDGTIKYSLQIGSAITVLPDGSNSLENSPARATYLLDDIKEIMEKARKNVRQDG